MPSFGAPRLPRQTLSGKHIHIFLSVIQTTVGYFSYCSPYPSSNASLYCTNFCYIARRGMLIFATKCRNLYDEINKTRQKLIFSCTFSPVTNQNIPENIQRIKHNQQVSLNSQDRHKNTKITKISNNHIYNQIRPRNITCFKKSLKSGTLL